MRTILIIVFLDLTNQAGWSSAGTVPVTVTRAGAGGAWTRSRTRAPLRFDVANATGDRLHGYIEGEVARRMVATRRQRDPDLGRRTLNISELYLQDEELYEWVPEPNETLAQYTRRSNYKYQAYYHFNYAHSIPHQDRAIEKMHSLMRAKMYRSRELLDHLKPDFEKHRDSLKMRFAFVFRRLDNLLDEMSAIYSHVIHMEFKYKVSRHLFYHQHQLRRHIDVVYIAERTTAMYMWYKERERRLNSILAQRMQTETDYAT